MKYIAMTQMNGIGPSTQIALLGIFGNIDSCYDVRYDDLIGAYENNAASGNTSGLGKSRIDSFVRQREDKNLRIRAEEIMQLSESLGIKVVVYEDMEYPDRFRSISDMPSVIYTKGKLKKTVRIYAILKNTLNSISR